MGAGNIKLITAPSELSAFFKLMPEYWQQEWPQTWQEFKMHVEVWAFTTEDMIVGGGLVFSEAAPELACFEERARLLFGKGAKYIGYLFTIPEFRGKGVASQWLKAVRSQYPGVSFWLTVEEEALLEFYLVRGFRVLERNESCGEWLLYFDSKNDDLKEE